MNSDESIYFMLYIYARNTHIWTVTSRLRRQGMSQGLPSLPANRAFVVQFRAQPEGAPLRSAGHVEHLLSGEVLRFDSQEQLLVFVHRLLIDAQCPPNNSGELT
jgi:hypothetical protein